VCTAPAGAAGAASRFRRQYRGAGIHLCAHTFPQLQHPAAALQSAQHSTAQHSTVAATAASVSTLFHVTVFGSLHTLYAHMHVPCTHTPSPCRRLATVAALHSAAVRCRAAAGCCCRWRWWTAAAQPAPAAAMAATGSRRSAAGAGGCGSSPAGSVAMCLHVVHAVMWHCSAAPMLQRTGSTQRQCTLPAMPPATAANSNNIPRHIQGSLYLMHLPDPFRQAPPTAAAGTQLHHMGAVCWGG
jgi:hypothetical protein